MPSSLSAKFQQDAHDKVATIHCLSFGEGGAFFLAWTSTNGKLWKCTSPRNAAFHRIHSLLFRYISRGEL